MVGYGEWRDPYTRPGALQRTASGQLHEHRFAFLLVVPRCWFSALHDSIKICQIPLATQTHNDIVWLRCVFLREVHIARHLASNNKLWGYL